MTLPFQTEPRQEIVTLGSPEFGQRSLPKFKMLTLNEHLFIREQTKHLPNLRKEAVRIAQSIKVQSGYSLKTAFDALVNSDPDGLLDDYFDSVIEFQDLLESSYPEKSRILATAMLRFRGGEPDWNLEDTGNHTKIHPALVEEIVAFAHREENGWAEPQPTTEEDLEKPSPRKKPSRTGKNSTGESSGSGNTTPDSIQ